MEVERMKTILKQVLITPRNYSRIAARIVPQDQREAIRPGIRISHHAFINRHGQPGYVIISHTTQRAGICFGEGRSEWGRWNEETGIITTDGGRRYDRAGEEVCDTADQLLEQGEATR
jgi:hypothetical protein